MQNAPGVLGVRTPVDALGYLDTPACVHMPMPTVPWAFGCRTAGIHLVDGRIISAASAWCANVHCMMVFGHLDAYACVLATPTSVARGHWDATWLALHWMADRATAKAKGARVTHARGSPFAGNE